MKKINNYHLFILICIIFILNIILFQSIKMSKAQGWQPPSGVPGQGTANIVTNPLSADLDLGGQSIVGEGNINANGTICDANGCIGDSSFSGDINVDGNIFTSGVIVDDSGGNNLIPNWQMESDNYWGDTPEQTSLADFNGVNHYAHDADEGDHTSCYNWAQTGHVKVDPSKTYKYTLWIKSTDTSMNNYFGFYLFNSSGNIIGSTWGNPYFKTSEGDPNEWRKWTAYLGPSYAGGGTGCDSDKTNGNDWCMDSSTAYATMRFGSCYADGNDNGHTYFMYPKIEEVDPDDSYTVGDHLFTGSLNVGNNATANAFFYSSDKQLKKDIRKINNPLDKIMQLEGVSFKWQEDNEESLGLIAQDVEKVFPELVSTNNEGLKTVAYGNLIAPLIEALKAQDNKIEKLSAQINLENSCFLPF